LVLLLRRKVIFMYKETLLFVHDMASAIGCEDAFKVVVRHIEFLFFEKGFDLLHLFEPIRWILQVNKHLMPDFLLIVRGIVNQFDIIITL
jgi:hypothetical protein